MSHDFLHSQKPPQVVSEESMTARLLNYGSQRKIHSYGKRKRETGVAEVNSNLFIPAYFQVLPVSTNLKPDAELQRNHR